MQRSLLALFVLALPALGCASESLPNPKDAVDAYAQAAAKGDADAIYDMMDEKSRRALSRDEVKKIVVGEKDELKDQSKAVTSPGVLVRARAKVRYADGETASLELDDRGVFKVGAAAALPAGAKTPEQALDELRRVLARRSYAGLMRVLSPQTRSMIESDLRSLVEGLSQPEGLDVQVVGDVATVQIPGGHQVKLRRDAGVWYVDDFE